MMEEWTHPPAPSLQVERGSEKTKSKKQETPSLQLAVERDVERSDDRVS